MKVACHVAAMIAREETSKAQFKLIVTASIVYLWKEVVGKGIIEGGDDDDGRRAGICRTGGRRRRGGDGDARASTRARWPSW